MNTHFYHNQKPPRRKILLHLVDSLFILFACTFSYGCHILTYHLPYDPLMLLAELLFTLVVHTVFSLLLRVNNIIWRYAGSYEYLYIVAVHAFAGIISFGFSVFLFRNELPAACYIFSILILLTMIVLSRIIYHEICLQKSMPSYTSDSKRLLIIGAGAAGCRLLEEIKYTPDCNLLPVGFVDDSNQKIRRTLHGIRVLGTISEIPEICENEQIDIIYLAIPSLSQERRSEVLAECLKTSCTLKTLPVISEIHNTNSLITSLRYITPEELLCREPMEVADSNVTAFIKGKRILITGGGGSIGSEICRQVAANEPERLVLVDVYENNAYDIQQELISKYGDSLNIEVYIATVCDVNKINAIFDAEKPEIVFHAAAHKHVPLMEQVPDEAVKNNVFGTFNTVMAARRTGVQVMVLISTDKAVNPTNIMGATKRMCEMIIQYADSISPDTRFTAVRFGNVLGSNGSVIPLFKKQIENRQDVTVTHPDIIRYFMTISEASQLVLTAGAMAGGGETFVLDMGKAVKIDDLAKNMIRLAGLTLGKDINIRYTGLRPGEKLYEELLMSEEGLNKTPNKKIFIGKNIPLDLEIFEKQLAELRALVDDPAVTSEAVEKMLMEIVPTFHRVDAAALPSDKTVGA
ncbi:MAG: polysaccharide biosynthesis protein [Clostridia bacterium]|nr:polysaccharide biosynthesis protein [Clostridia bacterium]